MAVKPQLEKKIAQVLPYACRLDVMNKLARSSGNSMPINEIIDNMTVKTNYFDRHIQGLQDLKLIKCEDNVCSITSEGKDLYKILQEIIRKAQIVET